MKRDKIIRVAGRILKWTSIALAAVSLLFMSEQSGIYDIDAHAAVYAGYSLAFMPLAVFAFIGHQFALWGCALKDAVGVPVQKGWRPSHRNLAERMFDFVLVFTVLKFLLTGGAGMAAYSLLHTVYALLAVALLARLAARSVPRGGDLLLSVGLLALVAADVFSTPVRVFVDGSLYRYHAGWDATALLATIMQVSVLYVALIGVAARFRPAKAVTAS